MRRCVTSPEPQSTPLRRRWFLFIAILALTVSAMGSWQASWAQPHQDSLRATVPDPTKTYTPGPTSTPTETAAAGVTRLLLRDEAGGYAGTSDTTISSYAANVPVVLDGGLSLKGNEAKSILMRFDLDGQIPAGATIQSAELVLYVEAAAGTTLRALDVAAFRVLRDWEESTVSWDFSNTSTSTRWGAAGCNQIDVDRLGDEIDRQNWQYRAVFKGFDVTDSVAYWLDHPEDNYGWLIKGVSDSTGSFSIPSSRSSAIEQRPVLRIDYTTGDTTPTPTGTVTPTETPGGSETPSVTETPQVSPTPAQVRLEAVEDTYLDSWAPDVNYGGLGYVRLRASAIRKPVVRFDLSILGGPGYDIEIISASLEMTTGSTAPSQPMDVSAYRMLTCWDEDAATWNLTGVGGGWDEPGASGAADVDSAGSDVVQVAAASTMYAWDVTEATQEMVDGENCGYMLIGPSSGLAECTFLSSEFGAGAPELLLEYLVIPQVTPTPTATQTPEGMSVVAVVFQDDDQDGFRSVSETGIPGVTVELLDYDTRAVLDDAITDAQGQATFVGLAADKYYVRQHNLAGYTSTTADEIEVRTLGPVNYAYFGDVGESVIALPCIFKHN